MEWVEGTFNDAHVTGIIVRKTRSITFRIVEIKYKASCSVQHYKAGDLMSVPDTYFKNHFLCFDRDWLSDLMDFALYKRNFEWVEDIYKRIKLISQVTV